MIDELKQPANWILAALGLTVCGLVAGTAAVIYAIRYRRKRGAR